MSKLDSALMSLNSLSRPVENRISAVSLLLVTLAYIVTVLSIPLSAPQYLIWFAVYPVIQSEMSGIGFSKIFVKSLWVLPLIIVIGIFNPFIQTRIAFTIAGISVSEGWVSFISIVIRGLLTVQAVFILAKCAGFYDMCNALRRIGCPKVLVTQIQFTYRYFLVVTEEALNMDRARKARGFGSDSYPFRMWGVIVGQLLIRSYERALRIHHAMLARGFNGTMPETTSMRLNSLSWLFLAFWLAVFMAMFFIFKYHLFF